MRPISATVDLSALAHNLLIAQRHAPRASVFAVIKANGYGHGLVRAARAFSAAQGYAVVELEAAVQLREMGYRQRIALLEGFFDRRELPVFTEHGLTAVVHCAEQLDMLEATAVEPKLDVMLKLNVGMNRLGFEPAAFPAALERLRAHPGVAGITLCAHLANADNALGIAEPLAVFGRVAGAHELPLSLANSAAVLSYPDTHFDWVRPGIMLYGCSPFAQCVGAELDLKPAMTLASEIISVRELTPGQAVGYGATFIANSPMRVGVVACGYADGYPRHAPTGTPVRVGARLTRTLGRVSMDMLCVDLTGIPEARVGSPVVLWGAGNPVENVAEAAGTVGYELLCALAPRVRVIEKD